MLARTALPDYAPSAGRARVAEHAVRLVESTDTVAIDAGPTAYAVATALPREFAGSVITHSMPVMQLLADEATEAHLVALGGELLAERCALVGPTTEAALAGLRARTVFLSPHSVDGRGLYACSPAEASVERRLTDIADQVVMVATAEAFSSSAPALVGPLRRLSRLITDKAPPPDVRAALVSEAVPVEVVG
jgi:DeoR family transcriptional regulator of aga operon